MHKYREQREVRRLKLRFTECAASVDRDEVHCRVVKRGVDGPGGSGRYWVVQVTPMVKVLHLDPSSYLILGPSGKTGRMEALDEGLRSDYVQVMIDTTGQAPNIESFTFRTVTDFARGIVHVLE